MYPLNRPYYRVRLLLIESILAVRDARLLVHRMQKNKMVEHQGVSVKTVMFHDVIPIEYALRHSIIYF